MLAPGCILVILNILYLLKPAGVAVVLCAVTIKLTLSFTIN